MNTIQSFLNIEQHTILTFTQKLLLEVKFVLSLKRYDTLAKFGLLFALAALPNNNYHEKFYTER